MNKTFESNSETTLGKITCSTKKQHPSLARTSSQLHINHTTPNEFAVIIKSPKSSAMDREYTNSVRCIYIKIHFKGHSK